MTGNWAPEHRSLAPRRPAAGRTSWQTVAFLVAVLLLGAYFRTINLFDWDGDSYLHPDERFLIYAVNGLAVPHSFGDYLQSACDPYGYVPSPRNPGAAPEEMEPSRDSGCNTLNPRNYQWSRLFVYGTLPTTLTRIVAEARGQTAPADIRDTGRALSTLFDLGSIVMVFFIGRRLYGRRVALLAALFYALAVLPIQLSHFFTVDAATGFFVLLAIYWAVRIAQGGGAGSFAAIGLSIGAAMACRVTMGTLALVGVLAVVVRALTLTNDERRTTNGHQSTVHHVTLSPHHLARSFTWLVLAGIIAFFTFRLLQPDAFVGSRPGTPLPPGTPATLVNRTFNGLGFFDIRPEPRFLANIKQASGFVSGEVDFPPGHQWANRAPFWFSWKNMVLWGLGVPLGIAAWLGWALAGWQLFRRRALTHLIPWAWIAFYYLWQGGQFVMTMRYYLLLYGLLALFAAWLVVGRPKTEDGRPTTRSDFGPFDYAQDRLRSSVFAPSSVVYRLSSIVVVIGTLLWAFAFTRIYTEPHSRITASRWIYNNIPPGAMITAEQWDDGLPLPIDGRVSSQYVTLSMSPYAEDDLAKYVGANPGSPGLLDQLDQADYVILSSNRIYDSIQRMPARYPVTMRYYHYLFSGELGFELAADIHSYPRLFGIAIPTPVLAEEAFSVYDHPRVLIFKKTPAYTRTHAEQLITEGVAWEEIYKLPAVKTGQMPTALRLTDAQWPEYREHGTWARLFGDPQTWGWLAWLPWLVALELLGLAAFGLLFPLLPRLPDRGFALSKTLGLLVVAYVSWLLASIGVADGAPLVLFTPTSAQVYGGLFVAAGLAAAWRNRDALRAFIRQHRTALLCAEGLFLLAFFGFVLVRALNPDLWHPARGGEKPMDLAFLTAVLKSPAFPPYDPWFAGGFINYYYFGFVLVGTLVHLTGTAPTVAYNLAVPTVFALTALGAWGVGYNLAGVRGQGSSLRSSVFGLRSSVQSSIVHPFDPSAPLRAGFAQGRRPSSIAERRAIATGLLAALFVVLLGNLAQPLWFVPGSANRDEVGLSAECAAASSYAAQQACRGRAEWAFWDATRLVGTALGDSTINEFPFFTFLYGDLHAHMLALPLALAALGLLVALTREWPTAEVQRTWRLNFYSLGALRVFVVVLLLALVIGALRATNTWDYPTYLGLSVAALGVVAWHRRSSGDSIPAVIGRWALTAVLLVLLSSLLFLPFTRRFATEYASVELWRGTRTPLAEFVKVNGLWLFILLGAGWLRFLSPWRHQRVLRAATPLFGLALLLTLALGMLTMSAWLVAVALLCGSVAVLVHLIVGSGDRARRASLPTMLTVLFAAAAFAAALLPELVTARGDIGRMNTVFKFGMQSWVLFAIASAVSATWLWQRVASARSPARWAWRGVTVLLVLLALVYPLTATPARLADRFDPQLGPTLDGAAFMRAASWAENGRSFDLAEDAEALRWLQTHISGTPIILEAQTEAYRWGGRVATFTGLPTLLGWPGHERQQRRAAQVDSVLSSRQALVQQLYNGTDAAQTLETLKRYGVEYVYVGQLERALYDAAGLAKFDALADAGLVERVYAAGGTYIYRVPATDAPPAIVTTTLPVRPPAPLPEKTLMLDRPVGELPAVNEYAWNPLGRSSLAAVAFWLLASYVLLLLGLPLATLVFGRWRDGGFVWARLIGLLLLGYAVWLPVSLELWSYNRWGLLAGVALVLALNAGVLAVLGREMEDQGREIDDRRPTTDDGGLETQHIDTDHAPSSTHQAARIKLGLSALWRHLRAHRRGVLFTEALFLAAFVGMAGLRALNPDLWQPIWGGEKPFEFGFFNAILRSPVMPPYNPFFSDGIINYYYYGLFLVSLPVKAIGIAPAIGFNLAVVTLFALVVVGAFALVAELTGRARYGLLGAAFVALFGNFAAVFAYGWSAGIKPVADALAAGGLAGFGARLDAWFVGPSRVIPNTINEFPFWSFLFADLHPHLIALPITLLAIAVTWQLFVGRRRTADGGPWQQAHRSASIVYRLSSIVIAALTLGTLAVTNSWDFPTYGLLVGGALLGAAWRRPGPTQQRARGLGVALLTLAGLLGAALLLFLPFFQNYQAMVQGIGLVEIGTALPSYLVLYGLFTAVLVPVVLGALWRMLQVQAASHPSDAPHPALHFAAPMLSRASDAWLLRRERLQYVLLVALFLLLVITAVQATLALKLWLGLLIVAGVIVLLSRRIGVAVWFGLWMAVVAWAVSLGIELIYIRDHLAGGEWQRMNTVFKFGMQIWMLQALAAAALLPTLLRGLRRRHALAEPAGVVLLGVLSVLALVFPLAGTPSRVAYRFPQSPAPTLDGLAFMPLATYDWQGNQIDLRYDAEAIDWLNTHIEGTPVVLQSSLEFYRAYGVRVAANTGLPTVVSPLHENEQRDSALVGQRDTDVQTIYSTPDVNEMLRLLSKYRVAYVYVGPIERAAYGEQNVAKFDLLANQYFDVVFRNEGVTIFKVNPSVYSIPPLPPARGTVPAVIAPAAPVEQASLEELEAQVAADPQNAGLAFDLALRYRADGRLEDAAAVLDAAVPAHPQDVALYHLYGDLLRDLGRTDAALTIYRQAATAVPTAANFNKLGVELFQAGRLVEAEQALAQALADGGETEPYFFLGRIYEQQDQRDQAIKNYESYLSVAPEGPHSAEARAALGRLR